MDPLNPGKPFSWPQATRPLITDQYPMGLLAALAELVLVFLSAHEAHWLRFDSWKLSADYLIASLGMALLFVLVQALLGSYASWRGRSLVDQLSRVCLGWLIVIGLLALLGFAFKLSSEYSRLWFVYTVGLVLAQSLGLRIAWALLLRHQRRLGRNLKRVVVLEPFGGSGQIDAVAPELARHGYAVHARLRVAGGTGWLKEIRERILDTQAHEIWICLPIEEALFVKPITYALRDLMVEIRFFPEFGDIPLLNYRVRNLAGMYGIDISSSPMAGTNRLVKRLEDLLIGGLIVLAILPLCGLIALAIRCTSPGPVLFRQRRLGLNGEPFNVYKFRSMEVHDEADGQVTQAAPDDPRITRLGRILRRTSLDELPQFFNVLCGEMSIVGPRPHALVHNEQYKWLVESYMKRHKVKPGITGWAQINGFRGRTDTLDKMQGRVDHDLWYINNWSLALDLRIIFLTVVRGFMNRQP
ncbi:undecaprenyl-phosphate glucose phosphotransferase [Castellaniella defragrans]|uniref:undecaprenyl-phosphate glucose phosphotransferase n=1 Tax=Castellaniella defragrans TaxID=75697 RepID=UPI002AFEBEE3|nr:undecaprenyl-phosphate glucose phosphotransferase [Castellaniella defragrans]